MDGALSNRSFLHMNLGPERHAILKTVIFMKDYSHVMKKVRNNTLKSGIKKTSTRNLTFPNDVIIQWQMYNHIHRRRNDIGCI